MYSVVADNMRRGNTGHTIGNAIVYEAVRTIASIYPNPILLQSGMLAISIASSVGLQLSQMIIVSYRQHLYAQFKTATLY